MSLATRGLTPEAFADRPHGTRLRYIAGCRCVPCRAANSRYESERAAARRRGEWNGLVSAARARRHLVRLSAAGVGRDTVRDVAGVSVTVQCEVRNGRKRRIRAATERAILAVRPDAAPPATLVDAAPTWERIRELLAEGYTRGFIAQRALGNTRAALQLQKDRITKANALKVERFYRLVMNGPGVTRARRTA